MSNQNPAVSHDRTLSALLVNPGESGKKTLSLVSDRQEFNISSVDTVASACQVMREKSTDVLYLTVQKDPNYLIEILDELKGKFPHLMILVESDKLEDVASLIECGVSDFIPTSYPPDLLFAKLKQMAMISHAAKELLALRLEVAMSCALDNLIGESDVMRKVKQQIGRVAPTDIPVLFTGPSGSGKSLSARVMHYHSERRRATFVTVDCSAFDESTLHVVLFGSDPLGQKTVTDRQPTLLRAHQGTLYLKTIEQLPPSVQIRLLEFLKESRFCGIDHVERRLNIRLIASTCKTAGDLLQEGFDNDLLQRLSSIIIDVPSLAQRSTDITLLTDHILRSLAREFDHADWQITHEALDLLQHHAWPGNIRELEQTLRRAMILCDDQEISAVHLGVSPGSNGHQTAGEALPAVPMTDDSNGLLERSQQSVIRQALASNNWNYTQTAQALGIGRTTLWRKVKKFNLKQEVEV